MSEHRNPTVRRIPIHDGEDAAKLAELKEAVEAAKRTKSDGPRMLHEGDPVQEATDTYNAFLAEANERATVAVVREVGRRTRRELLAECPPREGNKGDEVIGANSDELAERLMNHCLASPTFDSDAARDEWLESIGGKAFDKLSREAFLLNFGELEAPKALSNPTPDSDAT